MQYATALAGIYSVFLKKKSDLHVDFKQPKSTKMGFARAKTALHNTGTF